jgi:hypothetical protein
MKKHLLIISVISLLVSGCQSSQSIKQLHAEDRGFMSLWNTYSHCQSGTDLEQLQHDASLLREAAQKSLKLDAFVLPLPGKLDRFVATPSARLAVDVKAMSAACSLLAGKAAIEAQQFDIAQELLHSILAYHPQSDYVFYSAQAKAILSELEPTSIQVSLSTP